MRGHIVIHPQHPEKIETVLPLTMDEACTPICVIFVGSRTPNREWLKKNAKPLIVRREKVRAALMWLKTHNPLYRNIIIESNRIDSLHVGKVALNEDKLSVRVD